MINILSKKWELDTANRYKNRVKFITPPGHVELRQCLKYIEVRAVGMDRHCSKVREDAIESLEQAISVQPHLSEVKYSVGFYCPGSLSSQLHACEYNCRFERAIICKRNQKCFDSQPLSPQYFLWFEVSINDIFMPCDASCNNSSKNFSSGCII